MISSILSQLEKVKKQSVAEQETNQDGEGSSGESPSHSTILHRRQFLGKKLDNYKQKKLKRKLLIDAQLLKCAQEELEVKKRLVDRMDQMDNQYVENMKQMTQNMEKLTKSIAEKFLNSKTS